MKYCFWCHGAIKGDVEVDPRGRLKTVERCMMCARSTDKGHEFEVMMVCKMIDFEVSLPRGRPPQHQLEELFLPLEAGEAEEEVIQDGPGATIPNSFVLF